MSSSGYGTCGRFGSQLGVSGDVFDIGEVALYHVQAGGWDATQGVNQMGVDIHEKRRVLDLVDVNPAARRGLPSIFIKLMGRRKKAIIQWRKRNARSKRRNHND